MSTYVFAAATTACLFAAFAVFFRKGCGDPGCGTHARCGGCPNARSGKELDHA
jgi:hypothetical protein